MQVLIYEKAAASWIMLTTIFFLFCVLHKRKHCPYANSRKRGRGTTLTTSRRHDRSGAAAAERGLVFYYKLTAFDRSWLIHWKLKKVSPSFFLFFLSPYIRLGMNQVVLFFFASERAKLKHVRWICFAALLTLLLIFCFIELQVFVFLHLHYDHGRKYISYQRQTI